MEQEIFCIPLRSTLKNSRIHPRDPPTTRKGLRPLQPQKEERTACLPPTFLASCAEPPARSRPPPQRPPGTIVVDLAAGLRLSSVRTEGRLVSGSLVLSKPRPRSRRAARVGIASQASQPTPPTTTRGAAPCIPASDVSPADGSLAAHDDEEKFQKKQANVGFVACEISGRRSRTPCRVRAGSHGDHHDSHGERESLHSILAKRRSSATMELRSGECGSVPLREGALMSFSPLRGEKLRA